MTAQNGQPLNKESFDHLDLCCRRIAERYGRADISSWTNRDYIKLSSLLSHSTDVQISPNTLKRIFGKLKTTDRYYPQKATRDALARYSGFDDWDDLVEQNPVPVMSVQKPEAPLQANPTITEVKPAHTQKKWLVMLVVIAVVIIAILFWQSNKTGQDTSTIPRGVQLICNNPEGENPHSAVFRLQLPEGYTGSLENFTINFGDNRAEKKMSNGILVTHYYEIPGRYYAVLKYNNLPLDTVPIYLKTTGWTATATRENDTVRVYPINAGSLFKDGKMWVSTSEVAHSGVDTNSTFFVDFVNAKPMNISGDNFELTADVTTSAPRPGVRCSQVTATVYGEQSKHEFYIIKPGCVSWARLRFSEIYKSGDADDLSSLGADLTSGGIFKLHVNDKKVKIWINDQEAYATQYEFPLGNIYGIKIAFAGTGAVRNLLLSDLKTGESFRIGF